MKVTYNQIIAQFDTFFNSHYQVNSFGNGDLWEAIQSNQLNDYEYPLVWCVDNGARTEKGGFTLDFELVCMDIADQSESIENEIKSDTQQILLDALAYFKKFLEGNFYYLNLDTTSNLTSFTESTDDYLTGWRMSISLRQPLTYNECQIPYDGAGAPIDPTCPAVTVKDEDSTTLATVQAGGSYTVTSSNISNSDDSYSVDVLAEQDLELPNILFTDSDGTTTSVPSMQDVTAILCVGGVDESFWQLTFIDEDELNTVECTNANAGTFESGSGSNVGSITISTDDVTYIPLTFPYTTIAGNTYYFKRSTFTETGSYELEGEKTNDVIEWALNFEGTDVYLQVLATVENEAVFYSGSGVDVGNIEVSTDDVTYIPLTLPFSPTAGNTYYFKRDTFLTDGTQNLTGYDV